MPYNPEFHSSISFLEKTAYVDKDVINKDVLGNDTDCNLDRNSKKSWSIQIVIW